MAGSASCPTHRINGVLPSGGAMWLAATLLHSQIETESVAAPPGSIAISRALRSVRKEAWTNSAICWSGDLLRPNLSRVEQ